MQHIFIVYLFGVIAKFCINFVKVKIVLFSIKLKHQVLFFLEWRKYYLISGKDNLQ